MTLSADRPQRMIFADSLLGGNVAEHVTLLLIASSHAQLDAPCADSLQDFRIFQQPAKRTGLQEWRCAQCWSAWSDNRTAGPVVHVA
jgi:hypothetical protein